MIPVVNTSPCWGLQLAFVSFFFKEHQDVASIGADPILFPETAWVVMPTCWIQQTHLLRVGKADTRTHTPRWQQTMFGKGFQTRLTQMTDACWAVAMVTVETEDSLTNTESQARSGERRLFRLQVSRINVYVSEGIKVGILGISDENCLIVSVALSSFHSLFSGSLPPSVSFSLSHDLALYHSLSLSPLLPSFTFSSSSVPLFTFSGQQLSFFIV